MSSGREQMKKYFKKIGKKKKILKQNPLSSKIN